MKAHAFAAKIWIAVTCHRFGRLADLSARQSRVQRIGTVLPAGQFGGDQSPAQSADRSAHSKSQRRRLHRTGKTLLNKSMSMAVALMLFSALHASAQKREVLAIGKIETTKALSDDMQRKGKTVEMRRVIEAMDGHLISALAQTRKFTLVGRSDLADLLKEQDLGDSGIVDAGTAAEKGKVKGAKFRLVTTVDSFLEENVEQNFAGTGRKGVKRRFQLSAQAKVYDASTGELLEAPNVQIEKVDAIINDGTQASDAKRTDDLMPGLAREMAEKVALRVVDVAFPVKVIDIEEKSVTLNRGDGGGMKVGEVWSVFGPARNITDPDTGTVIKRKGRLIGKIRITSVDADSSQGDVVEGEGIVVGAILNRPQEANQPR